MMKISSGLAAAVITLFGPFGDAASHAAALHPSMKFVPSRTAPFVIKSTGWKPSSRVVFSVKQLNLVGGLELRTDGNGAFKVAVAADRCSNPVFTTVDFRAHEVVLHGPPMACAVSPVQNPPTITLLKGRLVKPSVYMVRGTAPRSVTLRLGDELDIFEEDQQLPAWSPSADSRYLQVISMGTLPARMCPQVDCGSQAYWKYVAIKAGQTLIDLSAACRLTKPPCMIPDLAITVRITK